MSDAIPAATVIVFRERDGAPPELLMVERAQAMVFAAGALVFPGGRIDPGDHALVGQLAGSTVEDAPARIAAIRETIEETGIAIGIAERITDADLADLRAGLHGGAPFADLLADQGLTLDLEALTPFARWRPAHKHMRIFDTHFYLSRLPAGAPDPVVDATENVRVFWAGAQEVIDEADAGRATIIFPTRRNLERLAQFASFDEAVADARAHPIRPVTPWIADRDGAPYLCIDDDLGYPVTSEPLTDSVRG
ncbi:NUDIX domain-containing protein [Sphingomonas koreensis]|nr:NUDIX domain-containing protein [Sphingomonas koreensis]